MSVVQWLWKLAMLVTSSMDRSAMTHAEITQNVRELARDTLGAEPRESILVRDGAYCGRRFDVEGAYAVWLIEEDQLTVFRADGSVLQTIERVSTAVLSTRMAA